MQIIVEILSPDVNFFRNHYEIHKVLLVFFIRHVSGFVTASRQRFVMLHDVKNEDGIKSFFSEMYEVSNSELSIF
jgi:hypothetical protein